MIPAAAGSCCCSDSDRWGRTYECTAVASGPPMSSSWCCGRQSKSGPRGCDAAPIQQVARLSRPWWHQLPTWTLHWQKLRRLEESCCFPRWPGWANWHQSDRREAFGSDGLRVERLSRGLLLHVGRPNQSCWLALSKWSDASCDRRSMFGQDCLLASPNRLVVGLESLQKP